jgi:putative nucleotidyltransferase with HDIG domain
MASKKATHSVEIDEELWFGSPGEDSELEERAAHSMAAVAARVIGAKPFPAAAKKLEEVTRGGGAKIEQVVSVLESDPGLSMRLLRLVNSAGYALRVRCTSVRHAAALVGMRRLHQLATTAAVLDLFENDRPLVKSLLNHAASVGAICRYLAVHVDLSPDELFTCGFLHDIGKLMLIDAEGQSYMDLLREAGDQPEALHLLERQKYGFDHAVLGAHVLKSWQIPNPVPRVVAWHHSVGRAYQSDTATAAMVQTLRLADYLSYVLRSHPDAEGIHMAAETDSARYLGVSEAQLSAMWVDLVRLSQRIHAQAPSGGSEIIPREDSIPPSMGTPSQRARSLAPMSSGPHSVTPLSPQSLAAALAAHPVRVSETPKAFECVVCKKASHGTRCPVCSGHVCSEHQVGKEQWCTECTSVYRFDVRSGETPGWVRYASIAIVLGAAAVSLIVALLSQTSLAGALLGSTLLSSVAVVALLAGRTVFLKRRFMQRRGQVVDGEATETAMPFGLTMQPEPEIAIAGGSAANVEMPSQAPPRWTRSELPSVLSFPPPAEPLRSGPHAHPNVLPSVLPAAETPEPPAAPATRTEPVPAMPAAPAAKPVPREAQPVSTEPEPSRRAPAREPSFDDAPGWRPVERTEPRLAMPSFSPPTPRPSPAAPLLAQGTPSSTNTPSANAETTEATPPSSSAEACKPPVAATLVRCRPASMRPAANACSVPEPR